MQLDLGFMMGAYLPEDNFSYCPGSLIDLMNKQADRYQLSPHMDYELLIDVNSREFEKTGQMRTYLDGEIGVSERDFYYGHYLSERHIKNVAMELRNLINNSAIPTEVISDTLGVAADSMREFNEYMGAYAKLPKEHFDAMRPYFASYPDGTRNASGAFMPSVQLAEIILHSPSVEQRVYIDESLPYFPLWSREAMARWAEESLEGHNIMSNIELGKLPMDSASIDELERLVREFYHFRTKHLGVTRKQIPQAFDGQEVPRSRKQIAEFGEPDIMAGGEAGTAGFHIVNVLAGSASRIARLRDKIDTMGEMIYKKQGNNHG